MNIKAFMLGGAALLLASAAYASQPLSSPAERAQTKDLNQQSLQAVEQGHDFMPQGASATDNSMSASNDSAAAKPAVEPTTQVARNDMAEAGTPLSAMATPPATLDTAKVVDGSGAPLGTVRKIETSASGAPLAVDVALSGGAEHVVAINATSLTYNSSDNVLTTQQSAEQIKAMPNAPQN